MKIKYNKMKKGLIFFVVILGFSCNRQETTLTAQQIVDKSIAASGGNLYENAIINFDFRDRSYTSVQHNEKRTLYRLLKNDSIKVLDKYTTSSFERIVNDSVIAIHDSLATKFGNSINSVHYFSKLPYGLNDRAVQKELLKETSIEGKDYFKVKVTFSQQNGGDDFDDTYVYFFNKVTFKPDFLAYDFHVDGGGMRFRKAYNERYVNGIRFVDYENLKPKINSGSILQIDSLYNSNSLELLSKIELQNIAVTFSDSYN